MFESNKTNGDPAKTGPQPTPQSSVSSPSAPGSLSPADRAYLLALARQTLATIVSNGGKLPAIPTESLAPSLLEKRACFVTLTSRGTLRGCVGHVRAQEPLCQAVATNVRNAALRDPRFPPVQAAELKDIRIEISILTEPQPLPFTSPDDLLSKLTPKTDGVLLKIGYHTATFLPQVWNQVRDKADFLNQLSEKAGCPAWSWRGPDVSVSTYRAESFEETT